MHLIRKTSIVLVLLLSVMAGTIYSIECHRDGLDVIKSYDPLILDFGSISILLEEAYNETSIVQHQAGIVHYSLEEQKEGYLKQQQLIQELIARSQEQSQLSQELYEKQLLERLGPVLDSYFSNRVEILLFELIEENYRGYIAKVKLFDPRAIRLRMAHDMYGMLETTLAAARRTDAVFGVNGGGFFQTVQQGQTIYMPLGNTVVDGMLLGNFIPSRDDVFFGGFNMEGELIGGYFQTREELMSLYPNSGASFVQILMKNRMPLEISPRLRNARHPRTVIGNFLNGDIFFMVIDGRQPNWSRGATLEEIQIKLLELGAVDAYNFDGGGSSTMVFKDRVVNRPSDGRERPVVTNFLIYGE